MSSKASQLAPPSPADTSRIVAIEASPHKLALLFVGGVVMTAASAAVAFGYVPDVSFFAVLVGYFGTVFFAFCTVVIFWRFLTSRGSVVTLSPQGIRDLRVAREFIPWSAIRGISTWTHQRQKVMVLAVDEATERTLTLTAIARWSRGPNRALGVDGLCVTAQGLKIDYDTLFRLANDYAAAHGPAATPDPTAA